MLVSHSKKISIQKITHLYNLSLTKLLYKAHTVHKKNFLPHQIQTSKLLSIKTGACPENCAYCPQSARYKTSVKPQKLMDLETVVRAAQKAKEEGATRFCMGAAWREIKDGPLFERVLEMVRAVKGLGLEVCCTLGMLNVTQAKKLKKAGLYAYNHNIDCSEKFYPNIITTRKYKDRLQTIQNVRDAGLTVCTGGILGMGENHQDRIEFLHQLSTFQPQPESVTINRLIPIPGTPLQNQEQVPVLEVVRVIATARLLMRKSMIRLSAGRENMTDLEQFLCFFAGANSIFIGEKLLTAANPHVSDDKKMFSQLGLTPLHHKMA